MTTLSCQISNMLQLQSLTYILKAAELNISLLNFTFLFPSTLWLTNHINFFIIFSKYLVAMTLAEMYLAI